MLALLFSPGCQQFAVACAGTSHTTSGSMQGWNIKMWHHPGEMSHLQGGGRNLAACRGYTSFYLHNERKKL